MLGDVIYCLHDGKFRSYQSTAPLIGVLLDSAIYAHASGRALPSSIDIGIYTRHGRFPSAGAGENVLLSERIVAELERIRSSVSLPVGGGTRTWGSYTEYKRAYKTKGNRSSLARIFEETLRELLASSAADAAGAQRGGSGTASDTDDALASLLARAEGREVEPASVTERASVTEADDASW